MRHEKWLKLCLRLTRKSKMPDYKHISVLIKNGRVISYGFNNKYRSGKIADPLYDCKGWHSEVDCLLSVHKRVIKGGILYNAAVTKTGRYANSKPCPCCQEFISKYDLKGVFYHDEHGNVCRYA